MKRTIAFAIALFTILIVPTLVHAQGWTIAMWHGDPVDLDDNWQLCDGSNGTPDLRDMFIVGAGDSYALDDTGGSATVDLEHSHTVASHSHSLPSHSHTVADHTHSLPSHTHTVANHTHSLPSHTHTVANHTHAIGNQLHQHSHTISSHSHELEVAEIWYGYGTVSGSRIGDATSSPDILGYFVASGGSGSFTVNRRKTTTTDSPPTSTGLDTWWHNHGGATGSGGGGTTGSWSGTSGSGGAGTTGNWSGTSGSSGAGTTGSWSGTSGNASPGTSMSLSVTENRPPYVAVYYICHSGVLTATSPITTSMLVTDPNTTEYYTVTNGVTYSKVRSVTLGEEVTNYLLIAILALGLLQFTVWFIVEGKRKWA